MSGFSSIQMNLKVRLKFRLIDFPDTNKTYRSDELWPFFLSRIPGLSQPAVKELLRKEKINEDDEAALLKRFGKTSITSPFTLVPEMA